MSLPKYLLPDNRKKKNYTPASPKSLDFSIPMCKIWSFITKKQTKQNKTPLVHWNPHRRFMSYNTEDVRADPCQPGDKHIFPETENFFFLQRKLSVCWRNKEHYLSMLHIPSRPMKLENRWKFDRSQKCRIYLTNFKSDCHEMCHTVPPLTMCVQSHD